jgi:hypothetical protein
LEDLGRDAFTAYRESLDIYRKLAADLPDHHGPDLARALINLGITLQELKLQELKPFQDGLIARREAVMLLRQCALSDPELYESRYRQADAAFRQLLASRGDLTGAITTNLAPLR